MIVSGNIYFILMFVVPASVLLVYNKHFRRTPYIQENKSVEMAECVFFCTVVFAINLIIFKERISKIAQYLLEQDATAKNNIMSTDKVLLFMLQYALGNIIVSIIVIMFYMLIIRRIKFWAENKIYKAMNQDESLKYADAWLNIFYSEEVIPKNEKVIVSIEKAGRLVTAGIVEMYPAPNEKGKSLLLYNTEYIMDLMEADKKLGMDYRVFDFVRHEFYDFEHDVLIKFYDVTKYDKLPQDD